ncbi:MAG: (Fe-S)-binding protein [Actinobacteria bacterium]|jgi:glycolate oxidase iron-sulfur subunit|nr:(Fe-S)-binding protein [Actinomycetota bacterium]
MSASGQTASEQIDGGRPAEVGRATPGHAAAPEEFEALRDHVMTCSKCGFCQPSCPIFRATGREAYVARGKVALYRNILEDHLEIGPAEKDAFSNCLLCRACADNCFPGIKTDDVVVSFRHAYGERFGRGFLQRRVFRSLLPRPRLMRALVRLVWAFRRTGLVELARRIGLVGLLNPKLERALELGAGKPGALLTSRLRKRRPPRGDDQNAATLGSVPQGGVESGDSGATRPTVGYWISCGYNYVLPEVGEATVRVLERMGYDVEVLDNCCCGLAAYGYGDTEAVAKLARENLRRLGEVSRFEAIVSECGSCSGHLKEYPHLLAGDPEWSPRAAALVERIRSFSEFVVERGGLPASASGETADFAGASAEVGATVQGTAVVDEAAAGIGAGSRGTAPQAAAPGIMVTYHDPCHLGRRYQNVVDQPRQILKSLPGVEFREMDECDSCCGAAGTYGILHPETSGAIIDRKMGFAGATGASVIATECPACMMQLRYGAQRAGLPVSVLNVTQLCDRAGS